MMTREIGAWWEAHKKRDAERKRQEAQQRKHSRADLEKRIADAQRKLRELGDE